MERRNARPKAANFLCPRSAKNHHTSICAFLYTSLSSLLTENPITFSAPCSMGCFCKQNAFCHFLQIGIFLDTRGLSANHNIMLLQFGKRNAFFTKLHVVESVAIRMTHQYHFFAAVIFNIQCCCFAFFLYFFKVDKKGTLQSNKNTQLIATHIFGSGGSSCMQRLLANQKVICTSTIFAQKCRMKVMVEKKADHVFSLLQLLTRAVGRDEKSQAFFGKPTFMVIISPTHRKFEFGSFFCNVLYTIFWQLF